MDSAEPAPVDLDLCAREPIRIPGGIQPHGALAVFAGPDWRLVQASANLGVVVGRAVIADGATRIDDLDEDGGRLAATLRAWGEADDDTPYLRGHRLAAGLVQVGAHRTAQGVVVEFEPADDFGEAEDLHARTRGMLDRFDTAPSLADLAIVAAREIRRLTGFDRVMVYRFDPDWNGEVVAEDLAGPLPSYLGLRFPASDIPAQARDLYRLNRLRLIPTADYRPVPIEPPLSPVDGRPLDLSFAALRSVSPVHLEYMRNMGTAASMSISLLVDGDLWGLISCHHAVPRRVAAPLRAACDFLGRLVAQQIGARQRRDEIDQRLQLKRIETELVAHLARAKTFQAGLAEKGRLWLDLVHADGAAVVVDGTVVTAGACPPAEVVAHLAEWLRARTVDQVYATERLAQDWQEAADHLDTASGVLAVPISRIHASFIMWFRPEVVRTVAWGGDPHKPTRPDAGGGLHPRRSFAIWKEQVHGRALPWDQAEILAAADFRNAIVNFVLQRAEERAQLSDELQRSNKELEAFSYSISHDLRAPFRHIVGYAQLLGEEEPDLKPVSRHYLAGISRAALSAGELVDDLLHFSQLGRASLKMGRIDMDKLAGEIRRSFEIDGADRAVVWDVGPLPPAWGDPSLIRQALYNLCDNALKYTRGRDPARVVLRGRDRGDDVLYSVEDNGVGFDMTYGGKLFQVFQRLHRPEDFEGTGIGLALTKRIVDRHGGRIEATGAVDRGATFSFSLPKHGRSERRA